jgi:hypothetical protein
MDNPTQRDQVFISYSHKDKKLFDQLQTSLKPLVRDKKISVWDDTKIRSGDRWREEIQKAIASAKVAVLLVSPDFLASDFIAEHELRPLLEAAKKEGLIILWIALRHSVYADTEIERYQAINDPSKPLAGIMGANREKEIVRICGEIKSAAHSATTATGHPQISFELKGEDSFTAEEPYSLGESNKAHNKVHKLIVFWFNLIITNFVIFAVANIHIGFILGIISLLLILPASIIISKLLGHSVILSALSGVLIFATIEGGIAYLLDGRQGVGIGILYGVLYGASLPSYFSINNKHTNIYCGALSTLFLVASIFILASIRSSVFSYISTIESYIGKALMGAIMTIILGLFMIPLLPHYIRRIDSFLDEFVDLARYEKGK